MPTSLTMFTTPTWPTCATVGIHHVIARAAIEAGIAGAIEYVHVTVNTRKARSTFARIHVEIETLICGRCSAAPTILARKRRALV